MMGYYRALWRLPRRIITHVTVCRDCGVVVHDEVTHTRWHADPAMPWPCRGCPHGFTDHGSDLGCAECPCPRSHADIYQDYAAPAVAHEPTHEEG